MTADAHGPPPALVAALVDGPTVLSGLEWHPETTSTNALAAAAAARGAPEVHAVLADRQTAGRGRHGREWLDAPGASLLLSLLLRPGVEPARLPLLALLAGLALADSAQPFCGAADVSLKWPNDLLVDQRKAAGILTEGPLDGAVIVGIGLNVDWRSASRPTELSMATSLAEARGEAVDRWKVLAGLIGVFGRRYGDWKAAPLGFLDEYRQRCSTIGQRVRLARVGEAAPLEGLATGVADDGALLVRTARGEVAVTAGDVEHVRSR